MVAEAFALMVQKRSDFLKVGGPSRLLHLRLVSVAKGEERASHGNAMLAIN